MWGLIIVLLVFICISIEMMNPTHARMHGHPKEEVELASWLPQQGLNCTRYYTRGESHGGGARMEVVSKYGPSSRFKPGSNHGFHDVILRDQLRVDSWVSKFTGSPASTGSGLARLSSTSSSSSSSLASHSAFPIGEYIYYVTVGLGTPKKQLSLAFDTGSSLTWTQCKPCVSCYHQVDPLFNPAASSTYSKLGCSSKACSSAFLAAPLCATSTNACAYNQSYVDGSFSVGYFARERLALGASQPLKGFYFGCGFHNEGLFAGVAGILGLDMGHVSIVNQAASAYGKRFSYCMPELFTNSTGHLTLGKGGTRSKSIKYTPLIKHNMLPNTYFVELQAISVAGNLLNIPATVLPNPNTIVDSGTALTYLPPKAYSAVLTAYTHFMDARKYRSIRSPSTIINGCYDLTGVERPVIPSITLFFKGVHMDMNRWGIVFRISTSNQKSEMCLAFASSGNSNVAILGNFQQETFDVLYDVDGGKIGFGANGC